MNWRTIWEICFLVTLTGFALMSILVTVGGAKDIRRMLLRLAKKDEERRSGEDHRD